MTYNTIVVIADKQAYTYIKCFHAQNESVASLRCSTLGDSTKGEEEL